MLERVVRWAGEFTLVFVGCNDSAQANDMRRMLLSRLKDKRILEVELEQPIQSLLQELSVRWNRTNPPDAINLIGLEKSIDEKLEDSPILGRLNHERELLRRSFRAALLIWL